MYANVGFDIISYLVEIISEKPFLTYCEENIFDPLNMYNTSFNLSMLDIDRVAIPYHNHLGEYYQINELSHIIGSPSPPGPYWKLRCYPAGGLYTTVNDLSHFLIAHMNDGIYKNTRILEKETVDLMHTIPSDNEIYGFGYGLAWMEKQISLRYSAIGHGGDLMGVDTWMLYIPSEDIGIIYFANGNPAYKPISSIGYITTKLLLYSLFKEGGIGKNPSSDIIINSNFSFVNRNVNSFAMSIHLYDQ
jgi:CubicO group peptidase (beta-lactamase class C family)